MVDWNIMGQTLQNYVVWGWIVSQGIGSIGGDSVQYVES